MTFIIISSVFAQFAIKFYRHSAYLYSKLEHEHILRAVESMQIKQVSVSLSHFIRALTISLIPYTYKLIYINSFSIFLLLQVRIVNWCTTIICVCAFMIEQYVKKNMNFYCVYFFSVWFADINFSSSRNVLSLCFCAFQCTHLAVAATQSQPINSTNYIFHKFTIIFAHILPLAIIHFFFIRSFWEERWMGWFKQWFYSSLYLLQNYSLTVFVYSMLR